MGQKMEIVRVFTTTNSTIQCIYAPIALRIICDKKCRYCVENSLLQGGTHLNQPISVVAHNDSAFSKYAISSS